MSLENRTVCLRAEDLVKCYGQGQGRIHALQGVSLTARSGELTAIMGPSGSGKSTLVSLLAGLETPTRGRVTINGEDIGLFSQDEIAAFRRRHIGVLFQFFNLVPTLTVRENVALPFLLDGKRLGEVRDQVDGLLGAFGLLPRADHMPEELSGGEMQRAAVARALVVEPSLVLADEPTGSLDTRNGRQVISLLRSMVEGKRVAVIVMTHDPRVADQADRVIEMRDGRIESTRQPGAPRSSGVIQDRIQA